MTLAELRTRSRAKVSKDLTSSDYSDSQVDADLNESYREVLGWAILAAGIWEFRGEMSTHLLVKNQNEYVLPSSDFMQINRVEVKYYGATEYVKAVRIDDKQVDFAAFQNGTIGFGDKTRPVYRLLDDSLFIYPPEDTQDATAGLAIEYTRDVTDLVSSSDKPNLPTIVQRALPALAALRYCDAEDMAQKHRRLMREIYGDYDQDPKSIKYQVEELIRNRDRSVKTSIKPRQRSYR